MDTSTNNQPITISTNPPPQPASNFRLLRSEGIQWLQKLAGNSWTDHNTHDPGITMLDLLCYAITDLSYRLDYNIKDLLATADGNAYASLYSPAQILTTNPVTIADFRKILLDVDGVKNAWVEKQTTPDVNLYYYPEENVLRLRDDANKGEPVIIKGIYNIAVDQEPSGGTKEVISKLQGSRNLCEDYNKITALLPQYIAVSGIVEIGQTADMNKTVAGILYRIASFISPVVNFYTLTEMLAKGKTVNEIFEGPALVHGFIEDDELDEADVKTELHTSDIIRAMMDEPGVLRVSNINVFVNDENSNKDNSLATVQNWFLQLDSTKVPLLDVGEKNGTWFSNTPLSTAGKKLLFKKNGATLSIDTNKVKTYFNELKNAQNNPVVTTKDRDVVPEQGNHYAIDSYYSIQNHFPQVYGIGEDGLPDSASPLRIAQAKQLKAYMLFFEQILADYFSQAAHLKDLFSFSNSGFTTYFYQSLQDIVPNADAIFVTGSNKRIPVYVESPDTALQRKNRFLDHLIARFGESLTEYTLITQSYIQGATATIGSNATNSPLSTNALEKMVSDKLRFLANYPFISNNRAKAFNYKEESWDTANVSGLEKRIAATTGIANFTRHTVTGKDADEEGFFLLEHILLRPVQQDKDAITPYLTTKDVERFEDAGNGQVICHSTEHGLFNGDEVKIAHLDENNIPVYSDTVYTVTYLTPDTFRIEAAYDKIKSETQWTNVIHTKYLVFTNTGNSITKFIKDNNDQTIICTSPGHGLVGGTKIEVKGNPFLEGLYTIENSISKDAFKINLPGTEPESYSDLTGTWTRIIEPDFYSLQFTCAFPAWTARFADDDFRTFIENTVRKETPVHLTANIWWLQREQMLQFEKLFHSFLDELKVELKADETDVLKSRRIKWRAYRNSLIDMLPVNVNTYPLADIPVILPDNTAALVIQYNEPAVITLQYSQPDVVYRIWDETGTQMNKSKNDEDNRGKDGVLSLTTDPLTRDNYMFGIEAYNPATKLSVRLFQTVLARIGINTDLVVTAKESLLDYGTPAVIIVNNAQSGTTYQLFDANENTKALSAAVDSNGGGYIEISTNTPLYEDIKLAIKATNTHTKDHQFLNTIPDIKVYPNINLETALKQPQVADYKGSLIIQLKNTQESTSYYLNFEDIDDDTVNKAALKGTRIGDIVPGNNGTIELPVNNLTEDLTVSITAQKNDSKIERKLPAFIVLPVKPVADKQLSIIEDNIATGNGENAQVINTHTIKISNTQPGIMYQLRKVTNGKSYTNIGNPIYHHKNHGIGRAKIETDFVIDTFTTDFVLLPAGVVAQTTTFNVLAIKATTKQQVEINKNIAVKIKA